MKHSDLKQNIIETASGLFYKNGYNLTGINEIISESNIAKATLYNHFKSKEDICIAYIQYMNSTFLTEIEKFCRSKVKGINQCLAIFDFLLKFFKDEGFNGCWCIKTVAEIPKENIRIKSVIIEEKKKFIGLLKNIIGDNKAHKTKKEIDVLTKQIYLLYESAVTESHLLQDKWPILSAKQLSKQILT